MNERGAPPARVRIGRVVRPHGLRGEVVVRGTPLSAKELGALGEVTLVRDRVPGERRERIVSARGAGDQRLVCFERVASLEAAAELRGAWIEAERAAMPDAGEGRIYHYDLLGLEVVAEDGRSLGTVREVISTGAHEVLAIDGARGELLLPYHGGTVVSWSPEERRLVVRIPEGLEEIYDEPRPSRGRGSAA